VKADLRDLANRTAVFGGAFDPPHMGHRIAAQDVITKLGCKRIVFVPTGVPAFKTEQAPYEARLALAKACFQGLGEVLDIESTDAARGNGSSSSFDTISKLKPIFGPLAFVVGADQVPKFPEWKNFPAVLGLCAWIILERKGTQKPALESLKELESQGVSAQWTILETQAPDLSSSAIRQEIALKGQIAPDTVHKSVQDMIKEMHLYGL
jgi:nicotinate-nucleotide adenylyltransferase